MAGYGPAPRAPAVGAVTPYPTGTVPGGPGAMPATLPGMPGAMGFTVPGAMPGMPCAGMAGVPMQTWQPMPQGMPSMAPMQPMPTMGGLQPAMPMPMPGMPTTLPAMQPAPTMAAPAPAANDSWAAVAAALGQLGYPPVTTAAPAAPAPTVPAAPAVNQTDAALQSALASLGLGNINLGALNNLDLSSLSSIPGLESLASIPGLESLFAPPAAATVPGLGSVASPGIVPSRARGKGKAPKGKAAGKGKPLMQDLPVLTSQEVQEPGVFVAAASQKDERKCRALLAHKDFNRMDDKDSEQRTAVHICILKKMPEDISLNILNREDFTEVNAIDQFGYTILSLAASNGMVGVCKAVLDHPEFTQVNSKDKWGATALHWAAASNLGSVCSSILEHPAFVEAHVVAFSFKFENQTALQVAEERGCSDAEQAIKKALSV